MNSNFEKKTLSKAGAVNICYTLRKNERISSVRWLISFWNRPFFGDMRHAPPEIGSDEVAISANFSGANLLLVSGSFIRSNHLTPLHTNLGRTRKRIEAYSSRSKTSVGMCCGGPVKEHHPALHTPNARSCERKA